MNTSPTPDFPTTLKAMAEEYARYLARPGVYGSVERSMLKSLVEAIQADSVVILDADDPIDLRLLGEAAYSDLWEYPRIGDQVLDIQADEDREIDEIVSAIEARVEAIQKICKERDWQ